jgi:hypothetical protein
MDGRKFVKASVMHVAIGDIAAPKADLLSQQPQTVDLAAAREDDSAREAPVQPGWYLLLLPTVLTRRRSLCAHALSFSPRRF